jgi:hypothetical protein
MGGTGWQFRSARPGGVISQRKAIQAEQWQHSAERNKLKIAVRFDAAQNGPKDSGVMKTDGVRTKIQGSPDVFTIATAATLRKRDQHFEAERASTENGSA